MEWWVCVAETQQRGNRGCGPRGHTCQVWCSFTGLKEGRRAQPSVRLLQSPRGRGRVGRLLQEKRERERGRREREGEDGGATMQGEGVGAGGRVAAGPAS